jgi:Tol biopolymer transport system component
MRRLLIVLPAVFVLPLRAADEGPMLRTFEHDGVVRPVAFAPDGKTLATGGYDRKVRLWDPASGEKKQEWTVKHPLLALAFAPDGKHLAAGTHQGELCVLVVKDGKQLFSINTGKGNISALAYAPDGKTLATADYLATISLWDSSTGKKKGQLAGHPQRTWSVAFSPDGKTLVSGGDDTSVRLWDVAAGKELRQLRGHRGAVGGVAFSRDGRYVASAGTDNTVRVWELLTGAEVLNLNGDSPHTVVFSPDGRFLFGATRENVVYVWSVADGKRVTWLNGHLAWVLGVAVSPDGKLALSGSQDKTARLWKLDGVLPAFKPVPLSGEQREQHWTALMSVDASKAYQAFWALASDPATVGLLEKALRPATVLTAEERKRQQERIAELLRDLDSDKPEKRDRATAELEKMGEVILPEVRRLHDRAESIEVLTRTAVLLDKVKGRETSPEYLREQRAIAVLERVGDARARRLLTKLSAGNPDVALTREAKQALAHLSH